MNFIEIMALYRAFSVGRFRCMGVSPKISVADFPSEGYTLVFRKDSIKKFCLRCIKDFVANRAALRMMENEKYLTIYSSGEILNCRCSKRGRQGARSRYVGYPEEARLEGFGS